MSKKILFLIKNKSLFFIDINAKFNAIKERRRSDKNGPEI